jgi:hypothetical protein
VDAVNYYGDTPLHDAVWQGRADVVRVLLAAGASPTSLNYRGLTPAHYAGGLGLAKMARAMRDSFIFRDPGAPPAELERRLLVADMVCMEPYRRRRVVFAMSLHARLGAQSAVGGLETALVRMVMVLIEAEAEA